MKDDTKLVLEALDKCLLKQIVKYKKDVNAGDDENNKTYISYALRCAHTIRLAMKDPSVVPLSVEKLNESKKTIEKYATVCIDDKTTKVETAERIKSHKRRLQIFEGSYVWQIECDVIKYIRDTMAAQSDDDESLKRSEFINFKIIGNKGYTREYKYYIENVFKYQLEFALRAENVTNEQYVEYNLLCESEYLDNLVDEILSVETMSFTFDYNPAKPLVMSMHEIEEFKDDVLMLMEFYTGLLKREKYAAAIIDFQRDSEGKFRHKNDIEKLFKTWQTYLDAFDYKIKGFGEEEIYDRLNLDTHVSDKVKAVRSYLSYAERYIAATEKGTFPHIA